MKLKIPNIEVQNILSGKTYTYPKYATQILNLANQNSQGTRAKIVGQMSDLIQQFQGSELKDWENWYLEAKPDAIENAADKVYKMIEAFKVSIQQIDRETVQKWIEELVIVKTYSGLKFQAAILQKVSAYLGKSYRLAVPTEESQGIDGFIGDLPVSIKPITYKLKMGLNEVITVPIIYYEKKKTEIVIHFDSDNL